MHKPIELAFPLHQFGISSTLSDFALGKYIDNVAIFYCFYAVGYIDDCMVFHQVA